MAITLNGTTGITTPALDTSGDVTFADNDKAIFGAGSDLQIYHDGSNSYIDDAGTGDLLIRGSAITRIQSYIGEDMVVAVTNGAVNLYHNNAEKLATTATGISVTGDITSSGTVIAGGTTTVGYKFHVYGDSAFERTGTASQTMVVFRNGNGNVGTINTSGSSTSYNTSSDYRLKTDAQPMVGASDRVQALKPVNFEWISSGERVDGFLAHEAQAIVPECVTGTKDAMRDEQYEVTAAVLDADGMVVTEAVMGTRSVPDYQGIDQSKLVPLLTAALQEALNKIEAMETRLAALEAV
jgi:hypothetical protein